MRKYLSRANKVSGHVYMCSWYPGFLYFYEFVIGVIHVICRLYSNSRNKYKGTEPETNLNVMEIYTEEYQELKYCIDCIWLTFMQNMHTHLQTLRNMYRKKTVSISSVTTNCQCKLFRTVRNQRYNVLQWLIQKKWYDKERTSKQYNRF